MFFIFSRTVKIQTYTFGEMVINGKIYSSDLIIFPDRVFPGWWRLEGHFLHMEDLAEVLRENPEIIILGTGYSGFMKVSRELREKLAQKDIEVFVEKTGKAVKLFNNLSNHKKVIAAFHLTC